MQYHRNEPGLVSVKEAYCKWFTEIFPCLICAFAIGRYILLQRELIVVEHRGKYDLIDHNLRVQPLGLLMKD